MTEDLDYKPEPGVQMDFSPEPIVNHEIPETPQIKEEPEEQRIEQVEEELPEFTAVRVNKPGSRHKFCTSCLTKIGVACKKCPHCRNPQPHKKQLMDSRRNFFKAKDEWRAKKKKNNSSNKEHDKAYKLLDRFSCLGFYPVLLLAKEHKEGVRTEIKSSLDFQLPENLKCRLKVVFEEIVNIYIKISEKSLPGNMDNADSPQLLENFPTVEESTSESTLINVFSPEPSVQLEIPETPRIAEEPEEQSSKNIVIRDVISLCDVDKTTDNSEDELFSCPRPRTTPPRTYARTYARTYGQTINNSSLLQQQPTTNKIQVKIEEQTDSSSDTDNDDYWESAARSSTAQMKTETDENYYNRVQIKTATHNSGLFSKYQCGAESRVTVKEEHMSETET